MITYDLSCQYLAGMCAKSLQSYLALFDPVACSPPGSSVHGTLQARILEGVAMLSSRGSSQPRDYKLCLEHLLTWQVGSLALAPPRKPPNTLNVVLRKNLRVSLLRRSQGQFLQGSPSSQPRKKPPFNFLLQKMPIGGKKSKHCWMYKYYKLPSFLSVHILQASLWVRYTGCSLLPIQTLKKQKQNKNTFFPLPY